MYKFIYHFWFEIYLNLKSDRIDQLTDVCRTLNINVLILSESKLDQTIPNNLITIPGYHEPLRHDRARNGHN